MEEPFRVPPVATLRSAWTPERAAVGAAVAGAVAVAVALPYLAKDFFRAISDSFSILLKKSFSGSHL